MFYCLHLFIFTIFGKQLMNRRRKRKALIEMRGRIYKQPLLLSTFTASAVGNAMQLRETQAGRIHHTRQAGPLSTITNDTRYYKY